MKVKRAIEIAEQRCPKVKQQHAKVEQRHARKRLLRLYLMFVFNKDYFSCVSADQNE